MMWCIGWLLSKVVEWEAIGRGEHDSAYMIRWVLWGKRMFHRRLTRWRCYLHWFLRSDMDTFHDHPGGFVSIILAGGYWEVTPDGRRRWYGPGRILRRPAEWRHRIELPPGKTCWTLFFIGPKTRVWGFWCPGGFMPWHKADANLRARGHVCESGG